VVVSEEEVVVISEEESILDIIFLTIGTLKALNPLVSPLIALISIELKLLLKLCRYR
jgi:hypothetical protein